ncbi:MAG: sce7726 family protein [Lachnospiraceae bacterium]|nr:sce7726 family protein [Lachnospiraceae bacterium]
MLLDKDIREPLFEFLESKFGRIRILEEVVMGRSRSDVIMVAPEMIYGIEIKSDADTYVRLSRQVKDYDRYFDRNIIVAGSSHGVHIKEHVPDHWGIITVEENGNDPDFYILRYPSDNKKVNLKKKLEFLWRPELYELQKKMGMYKYKDKSKAFVIEKMISLIPERISRKEFDIAVSDLLIERDYTRVEETLAQFRKG